jgi:hypothetical protein
LDKDSYFSLFKCIKYKNNNKNALFTFVIESS